MKYDKLIRDNIPAILQEKGIDIVIEHATDDKQYEKYLFAKVLEELDEFKEDPSTEELADIIEVLRALAIHYDLSDAEFEQVSDTKFDEKGGFEDRIILKEVKDE